jgi:hypothetical protein
MYVIFTRLALFTAFAYSPNGTMVNLNIGFTLVILALQFLIGSLWIHSFNSSSVYDLDDDLVTCTVKGSDEHTCHKSIL